MNFVFVLFQDFLDGLIFILPAYFANMMPVYINGIARMDAGFDFFDSRPLFGKNKTIGGLFSATLSGGMMGIAMHFYFPEVLGGFPVWIGFIQGIAVIIGDTIGSFVKRRLNVLPGGPFPIVDQIGFVIASYLLCMLFIPIPLIWPLIFIPLTLILHIGSNYVAYKFGWKKVWW